MEEELQKLTSVDVEASDGSVIQVVVVETDDGVSAKDVCRKVCQDLDLKNSSNQWFSVHIGRKRVKKRYKDSDFIPSHCQDLCLRKFCFNQDVEEKLIKSDPIACHLLYKEAVSRLKDGSLLPSKEQKETLEYLADPNFTIEHHFLSVCHQVPNYFSVRGDNCSISLQHTSRSSSEKISGSVTISTMGVNFNINDRSIDLPWCCITRWSHHPSCQELGFEFIDSSCLDSSSHPSSVTIRTDQADYLFSGTNEFIKEVQHSHPDLPLFHSSMISTSPEGKLTYENALFNEEKSKHTDIIF